VISLEKLKVIDYFYLHYSLASKERFLELQSLYAPQVVRRRKQLNFHSLSASNNDANTGKVAEALHWNSKAHRPRTPENRHNGHFIHWSLGQVSALGFQARSAAAGGKVEAPGVDLTADLGGIKKINNAYQIKPHLQASIYMFLHEKFRYWVWRGQKITADQISSLSRTAHRSFTPLYLWVPVRFITPYLCL